MYYVHLCYFVLFFLDIYVKFATYVITHRTVKKGDVLKLKQARGGGFAVSLMAK